MTKLSPTPKIPSGAETVAPAIAPPTDEHTVPAVPTVARRLGGHLFPGDDPARDEVLVYVAVAHHLAATWAVSRDGPFAVQALI